MTVTFRRVQPGGRLERVARGILRRARHVPFWVGYEWGPMRMSRLRQWWVLFRHPYANIQFHNPVYLGPGFSLHIPENGTFIVGPGTEFRRNFRAEVAGSGRIVIGAGCYFTYDVILACSTAIEIGDRVGLANESAVYDGNHRYEDLSRPFLDQGYEFKPIRLEDDVQVHQLCTIVESIGTRAVIGANSVVSRPVPAYTLAVGTPARPIKYFGPEELRPPELEPESSPQV